MVEREDSIFVTSLTAVLLAVLLTGCEEKKSKIEYINGDSATRDSGNDPETDDDSSTGSSDADSDTGKVTDTGADTGSDTKSAPDSQTGSDSPGNDAVQVFILAGQSNMAGTGTVSPTQDHLDKNGGMGTLEYLWDNRRSEFGHLAEEAGNWVAREDVWLVDLQGSGPLTIKGDNFGPELQFGHVTGEYFENQVLIIKVAWGGKSLAVDFRPPSSGGEIGPSYTEMMTRIDEVLGDIGSFWPSYVEQGYEIAGFGWHHGWNDRVNQEFNDEYQTNCVNLINDLRDELGVPQMPFVLATTGISGWDETHPRALSLMEVQLAVPSDPRLKAGNVFAVETRDFWRDQSESPVDQGYHWNRNAETIFLIGESLAQGVIGSL